jgi:hypothetical protein
MAEEPLDDPFAPPGGDAPVDLAIDVAVPVRRPPANQTVAEPSAEPAAPTRGLSAERSASSSTSMHSSERSGLHRQPKAPEYKGPREGMSNLILWGCAGLGVLAILGSLIRFLRSDAGSTVASAVTAVAEPTATPTVWKPVELGPNVLVTIDVSPRSARLLLDGEPLASNPVPLTRGTKHTIGALADGFEGGLVDVVADKRKTVRIVLRPSRKRR